MAKIMTKVSMNKGDVFMQKIFIGKTVDEAKEAAIKEFNVDVSRVSFEILEETKRTLFGKSKGEAKISASFEETKVDIATGYIKNVLSKMDITDVTFKIEDVEGGSSVEILSSSSENFIGKKGEILDSLQYLSSLVCNKGEKDYYRISLDSNGYREKRKEQLEVLAERMARSVLKNGRSAALEPMNPYERRIVHAKVAEVAGVSSHSTGQDPFRKVIISSNEKRPEKKLEFKKNNNNNSHNSNTPRPQKFDFKTSFEKDYKKPRPEDNLKSGLYSKIEF